MSEDARALYEATTNPDLEAELKKRGLSITGNKAEMVDRLLAHDAEQETGSGPAEPVADADAEICVVCWPDGWPSPDTANASCEHGVWDRAPQAE